MNHLWFHVRGTSASAFYRLEATLARGSLVLAPGTRYLRHVAESQTVTTGDSRYLAHKRNTGILGNKDTQRPDHECAEAGTTHLYRYVLENHGKLSLYTMCNHVERLYEANMADVEVTNLLRLKLVDSLSEINTAIVMGRVLYLLGKSPSMDDNFFVMITNHIHRNQLYPAGDSPRLWCRYFKFIGDNRIYHRPLLEVLAAGFYDYLADRVESATGPCSRRMQEAVALASWALAISAPDLALDHLFGLMLRFVAQPGVDRSVVIRVYWSSAISNRLLENLDIKDIGRMLDETLAGSNVGPRHKSHLHQIYTTLRCLNMAGIEDKGLTKRCLESLHALRYGYNDSKISTSQRYVSDVLVRLGVPHRVEVLTPDLLSIDIAIEGDGEQIALEVDGPLHFIRVCDGNEDSTPMHTGPTRAKQTFLRSSGWLVVSAPPVKLDDGDDLASSIASVDMYYKKILMNSGSKYLNRLLG